MRLDKPLFSIAIPTYNRLNLFKQALDSAQQQDYPNLEIVIFDNHSTDGTDEYIEKICSNDPRVRTVRYPENIGGIKTYENILTHINGKYLLALADDDCIEVNFCSTAVNYFTQFPSMVLWVCLIDLFFGKEAYQTADPRNVLVNSKTQGLISGDSCIKKSFKSQVSLMFCATVYLVAALKKAGGFSCGSYSLDLAATLSTAYYGDVYLYPQILAHARVHETNTSNNLNASQPLKEMDRMLKLYRQLERNAGDKYKPVFLSGWLSVTLAKIITYRDLKYLGEIYRQARHEQYSPLKIIWTIVQQSPKMFARIMLGSGIKMRFKLFKQQLLAVIKR